MILDKEYNYRYNQYNLKSIWDELMSQMNTIASQKSFLLLL